MRLVLLIAAVALAGGSITRDAAAQDTKPATPTQVRILDMKGTPQEQSQIDAITVRVKTRLGTDAVLVKRVDDALTKNDVTTARTAVADAIGVKGDEIYFGATGKVGMSDDASRSILRLASLERVNPFYIIVVISASHALCFGTKQTCHDALIKAGYTPVSA
jgi:hypothetical protein